MTSPRRISPLLMALFIAAGVVAVQALLVSLFAGVAANTEPRDLPIVAAGPPPAVEGFTSQLAAGRPGAFEVTPVTDAEAAQAALRDREAYAAFVLGPGGVETIYTASAASPAVAQLVAQAATELGDGGAPVPVVDLVPGSAEDPRGAGLGAGLLPLVLTSLLAGAVLAVAVPSKRARLLGLAAYAMLAGLVGAAVMQGWLGIIEGGYLTNAAAIGLVTLAAAATVTGLASVLGAPGIVVGAVLVFLVGNPLSAVNGAPELLPQPWGTVGQWLPPGAGGTLLRSVAWFAGSGAAQAIAVLAGWAVLGTVLVLVGRASVGAER